MKKGLLVVLVSFLFVSGSAQTVCTVLNPTLLLQNPQDVKIITKVFFANWGQPNNNSV